MRRSRGIAITIGIAVGAVAAFFATAAAAQDASAQAAYRDIEQTFGSVPDFFKKVPETGIAGAWAEMKSVQLNPNTKLLISP